MDSAFLVGIVDALSRSYETSCPAAEILSKRMPAEEPCVLSVIGPFLIIASLIADEIHLIA